MNGFKFDPDSVFFEISGKINILSDDETDGDEDQAGGNLYGDDETTDQTQEDETEDTGTEDVTDSGEGPHNFEEGVVHAPTCTEYGYTEYTCTACEEVFIKDIVEPAGHSYEAAVSEDGTYTTYTCSVCGDTYTEVPESESEETAASGQGIAGGVLSGAAGYVIAGAAGLVIGIVLTVILLSRFMKKKRGKNKQVSSKKKASSISGTSEINTDSNIVVGKLHAQGARENQQDSFAVSPPEMMKTHGILAVVADGMGGLSGGERVSQMAVSTMMDGFPSASGSPDQILLGLLQKANSSVNRMLGPSGLNRSGSTMAAALIKNGLFYYISVGDSRIALLRDGCLYQLNRDHVYCNELAVDAVNGSGSVRGAFSHPKAHGLTSFIGMGRLKYVDIPARPIALKPGDRFVLMSDGVYNALTEGELADAIGQPAEESADYLGNMIRQKNYSTQDNYTAVILTVQP